MEISIKNKFGAYLVIKADNVVIEEDIEKRVYQKDANGKAILTGATTDIDESWISMFERVLDDMVEYRKADYDSSCLIKRLFQKLPENKANDLLTYLQKHYGE
jgi:hypothetical protein